MNNFQGHISDIQTSGHLSIVDVKMNASLTLSAIVIDTPETASYLKINHPVRLLFKETEVIIGLDENPTVSLQNKIRGTILQIDSGDLLSRLVIGTAIGDIVAVISSQAVTELAIKENLDVTAMVNINEVILAP